MTKQMEKLDGKSMDIVGQNIQQLKEIFPEVFAEGKISFDKLQELLGNYVVEDEDHYNFTWHGKRAAGRIAQTPSTGTLRPAKAESVDWETTQNMFIEGDNLEVLKLLQKSYHRKVKMIYIDPPYNTGKEFIYPDKYKDNLDTYLKYTGQVDAEGYKFSANTDTTGRYHTNWLNMMYTRLKLARNLLRDDGVIFISIDDREQENLKKLCNEIFGEQNFVGTLIHQRAKGGGQAKYLVKGHDYIHVYFKVLNNEVSLKRKKVIQQKILEKDGKQYIANDDVVRKKFGKYDKTKGDRRCFYEELLEFKNQKKKDEIDALIKDGKYFIRKNKDGLHIICELIPIEESSSKLYSIIKVLSEKGKEDLEALNILGFDYPKPVDLVRGLIEAATLQTKHSDIILDFFAGSGTTAHAAMQLNAEDVGNRKYICVQLPERLDPMIKEQKVAYEFCRKHGFPENIAEIGKERIRRAAKKIKEENPDYEGDLGFKVFKLDSSNIKHWEASFETLKEDLLKAVDYIKNDRSSEDILYEILLKYGLDLTVPIETRPIGNKTIYLIGLGALVVCLEKDISMDVVTAIGKLKEELNPEIMRVVFKDESFKDDVVKTNTLQTLRNYGIENIKSL